MSSRFFVVAAALVGCGTPPSPVTPVAYTPAETASESKKAPERPSPVLGVARTLGEAFAHCDRPAAKRHIMTFEEAAVMVTKELPRDRWETSIEQAIDQSCRELEGATVVDVTVTGTEVVKPSDKDLLNREITLISVEMVVEQDSARRNVKFAHSFIETRDGWKMAAEN